jgi:hypothetical protein
MTHARLRIVLAAAAAMLSLAFPALAAAKGGDRDRDGMPDRWERKHKLNVKKNDARGDRDRDGLRNLAEFRAKTNPARPDSDRDGRLDGDEDRDRDRVDNANEDRQRTHPRRKDSDRDGVRDGDEDTDRDGLDNEGEDVTGNDPIDPDTDDDGVKDGAEEAGVVESFEDGVLTVRIARGGSVSGRVTGETEIECKSEGDHESWKDDEDTLGGPEEELDDDSRNRSLDVIGSARHSDPLERGGEWEDDAEDLLEDYDDEWEDENGSEDSDDSPCGVDALVPGAVVHEAELVLLGDGPVFLKVELVE